MLRAWSDACHFQGVLHGADWNVARNFVTVYYGTAAKHVARLASGQEKGSTIYYVGLIVGLVAAIAAVAVVAHVARRALKNAVEASEKTSADMPIEGA